MEAMEGGCACGAVRYRVKGPPIFVMNCHCTLCQRQTGTASALNALFEAERLEQVSGEVSEHEVATGSGRVQAIVRCAACGTAVWSFYPRLGRAGAAIRVGTLDDPSGLVPDAAIFVSERPAWVALPEGIAAFEGAFDLRTLPPERLARLTALLPG
jgi:hypothetical protein